ncbi:MAG: FKBP-type peptidyl-prolyl cis-trans isomerase [Planctomycetota bacterium]|jgi:FKBP-type peptidyl-prolyl cis-trans isomerase
MRWIPLIALLCSSFVFADRALTIIYKESEAPNAPVAGEMQLYSNSHALVIGIDNYSQGWPRLSQAVNDAKKVAAALEQKGFEVTLLTDLKGLDLGTAFEDFFIDKGDDPEARLFVWFAGHGHTVDGEGFLIPADGVVPNDARNFKRKSLSLRRFGEFVRLADSKHVYTIFDSCFAGTIFNVARAAPPPAITRVTTEPVRQFLSSGDAGQTVSDDGAFANLFVEALEGKRRADLNSDGYLTAEELGSFLVNKISNYTSNKQVPRYGKLRDPKFDRGDFVFVASTTQPSIVNLTKPASPTSSGEFSLDAITQQAEAERAARRDWDEQLSNMKGAYTQVKNLDTDTVSAGTRIAAWQKFQTVFREDNPHSQDDDAMRRQSSQRVAELMKEQQPARQQIAPGLSMRILKEGAGDTAESGRLAFVHYTGWLYDETAENSRGKKFDSSVDRDEYFSFMLGAGRVIRGWDQGVVGMKVGETRELTIAPELGYGERGAGSAIPPGATLVFEVELFAVE